LSEWKLSDSLGLELRERSSVLHKLKILKDFTVSYHQQFKVVKIRKVVKQLPLISTSAVKVVKIRSGNTVAFDLHHLSFKVGCTWMPGLSWKCIGLGVQVIFDYCANLQHNR
jgi:hypothetical protein